MKKPKRAFGGPLGSNAKPTPPSTSYWVGADREALQAAIKSRRAQQRIPSDGELLRDPAMSATLALKQDHGWKTA